MVKPQALWRTGSATLHSLCEVHYFLNKLYAWITNSDSVNEYLYCWTQTVVGSHGSEPTWRHYIKPFRPDLFHIKRPLTNALQTKRMRQNCFYHWRNKKDIVSFTFISLVAFRKTIAVVQPSLHTLVAA